MTTTKTTRIISIILTVIPSLMLIMSGIMKLAGAEQIVTGLTKAGLGSYVTLFGIIELAAVALFWFPKTYKIGFLLISCYLAGALSIELTGSGTPTAAILLVMLWIGLYLKNKHMFVLPKTADVNV
ncbi:MAG: DoxX family protein [Bacteroidota bacterium]